MMRIIKDYHKRSWRDEFFLLILEKVSRVRMYSYSDPGTVQLCVHVALLPCSVVAVV